MALSIVGSTLDVIGKVLLGVTVINVHTRVMEEHKIDQAVFKAMKREKFIGIISITLIIVGFILQLPSKL